MSKAAKLIYSKFLLIPCICSSSFWHDCSIVAVHPTLKWSDATILVLKQLWGSHRCQSTLAPQLCKHWQHQVRLPSGWVSFTGIQECRLRPTLRSSFPNAQNWPQVIREDRILILTDLSLNLEKSTQHPVDLTSYVFFTLPVGFLKSPYTLLSLCLWFPLPRIPLFFVHISPSFKT